MWNTGGHGHVNKSKNEKSKNHGHECNDGGDHDDHEEKREKRIIWKQKHRMNLRWTYICEEYIYIIYINR